MAVVLLFRQATQLQNLQIQHGLEQCTGKSRKGNTSIDLVFVSLSLVFLLGSPRAFYVSRTLM